MTTAMQGKRGEVRKAVAPKIGIVGDFNASFAPHIAVEDTLKQVHDVLQVAFSWTWIATETITSQANMELNEFDGLWISPGSPYRSFDGALAAIRVAREHGVPLLGTCGGFQHVVVEFGRHVLGLKEAHHEEVAPTAECLIVTALTCSPAGQTMRVRLLERSEVARWYGSQLISEKYFCNYGINPVFESRLEAAGLRVVGRDMQAEARVLELHDHPFFVAALYVPHPATVSRQGHPLVAAFVAAAEAHAAEQRVPKRKRG